MVHGMGAGVGLWVLNYSSLAEHRPVYAFDVLGFGRSSRPDFSSDALMAEMELVESVEDWRKQVGLDKFILLGHSMGGFIAASYAIRYPDRISHLILADPWGFSERPESDSNNQSFLKMVAKAVSYSNPLAALRVIGPFGKHPHLHFFVPHIR